jgi:predicted amidohydrolase YtcJ
LVESLKLQVLDVTERRTYNFKLKLKKAKKLFLLAWQKLSDNQKNYTFLTHFIMKQLFFFFLLCSSHLIQAQIADKVFKNAKIYTANSNQQFEEAIAIHTDTIIYVGSNIGVQSYIDSNTTVIDVMGDLILPGLHDVHMHPLEAGSSAGGGCLLDQQELNPENFIPVLQACNVQPNSNGWIVGSGHALENLLGATREPRFILDDIDSVNPIMIMEYTSHSLWVNSKALELVGFDTLQTDPVGGHIMIDNVSGHANGILLDNAGDAILSLALASNSTLDSINYEGLINNSLPDIAANGITSICEARTYWKRNYQQIWQQAKTDGELTCRVVLNPWAYPDDPLSTLIPALQSLYDTGDDMLRSTQVKVYSDGITINATASLFEPYNYNYGFPFTNGLVYFDALRLTQLITALEPIGYDFHIHSIGDKGASHALDAIENAGVANGSLGQRHRLTHLEIVRASDIPRFAQLGVIADMQVAGHFTQPSSWSDVNYLVGAYRTDSTVPLRALYDANARINLSSDWDVSSINPFVGMENAITRSPQNLPNMQEVVDAYTIHGAYTMRQEDKTGSLEVGKYADLVWVDQDIFTIPPNQIGQTNVVLTLLGGQAVYNPDTISLAVNLVDFDALKEEELRVKLNWSTENEGKVTHFDIEQSKDAIYFKKIGEISPKFNEGLSHYCFTDLYPNYPVTYYRIKTVEKDYSVSYSTIRCIRFDEKKNVLQISPNPANISTNIALKSTSEDSLTLELYSPTGILLLQQRIDGIIGNQSFELNTSQLESGIYIIKTSNDAGLYQTKQLIIAH